ncbi:MAG: response regulator, partial [Fibrobacterota bacterium]
EIRICKNELEALVTIGEFKPDLIILDYQLIEINGLKIATQIRENKLFENTPIILISGIVEDVPIEKYGINAFIRKPFTIGQIEEAARKCLKLK